MHLVCRLETVVFLSCAAIVIVRLDYYTHPSSISGSIPGTYMYIMRAKVEDTVTTACVHDVS